eukprot:TRINITY_DN18668_c0_g1_i1.p1 TRINITY_DN18668_c0_g1~~TRINITY_DN18668_c0_g1_i1.p1  ORF type:complete len:132 (-),score=24.77 TRINITY_DN18668_c0_g1_i1:35-430(-)
MLVESRIRLKFKEENSSLIQFVSVGIAHLTADEEYDYKPPCPVTPLNHSPQAFLHHLSQICGSSDSRSASQNVEVLARETILLHDLVFSTSTSSPSSSLDLSAGSTEISPNPSPIHLLSTQTSNTYSSLPL